MHCRFVPMPQRLPAQRTNRSWNVTLGHADQYPRRRGEDANNPMYMVSWIEDEGKIEASLGGRITVEEMHVFSEELKDVVATFENRPFVLTIDHSKAKPFDVPTQRLLADLKDRCLAANAEKIVTMVEDEEEMTLQTHERLQAVLEGKEEIRFAAIATDWQGVEGQEVPDEIREAA
jgi:hypothetical protein